MCKKHQEYNLSKSTVDPLIHISSSVRPRVRLISKESTDTEGAKITCLAFGFYPRHINLTLLRDGQPVAEHELKGGQLLPNGDWTYQLRKSLTITVQELRERPNYTCTANHISIDNKLDVSWGKIRSQGML